MKKSEWNEALNHIDDDLVERYVAKKESLAKKKKIPQKVLLDSVYLRQSNGFSYIL